jgi:hypothetical protein
MEKDSKTFDRASAVKLVARAIRLAAERVTLMSTTREAWDDLIVGLETALDYAKLVRDNSEPAKTVEVCPGFTVREV